jgi:hypothetical protein
VILQVAGILDAIPQETDGAPRQSIALALAACARADEVPSEKLKAGGDEHKQ